MAEPMSRIDAIILATINGEEYNDLPQSRVEEELLELKAAIEEGGGGGTKDYNQLINRPHTADGRPLEGDITDEVESVTQAMTPEEVNKIKGYLNDDI